MKEISWKGHVFWLGNYEMVEMIPATENVSDRLVKIAVMENRFYTVYMRKVELDEHIR